MLNSDVRHAGALLDRGAFLGNMPPVAVNAWTAGLLRRINVGGTRSYRPPAYGSVGTEQTYGRRPHRRGEMHDSRVAADQQIALLQKQCRAF